LKYICKDCDIEFYPDTIFEWAVFVEAGLKCIACKRKMDKIPENEDEKPKT
jgi:DNA-directed RNA polymerase subunit RPC12/RpoP